jgi:predicted ATPase
LQLVNTEEVCAEDSQGTIRYHLADETFWRTRLYASEEREALCGRHRDYYLQWVALSARPLEGIKATGWLEQLKSEYDNLWAALLWSWREKDTEAVLSLVNTLYALLRRPAT